MSVKGIDLKSYAIGRAAGSSSGGGDGGGIYTLLASRQYTVSQASTTSIDVDEIDLGPVSEMWVPNKIIYIAIKDNAGKRNGYFYSNNTFILNYQAAQQTTDGVGTTMYETFHINDNGELGVSAILCGVYVSSLTTEYLIGGEQEVIVRISARYNANFSGTIDGTYTVDIYALDYSPSGAPFD